MFYLINNSYFWISLILWIIGLCWQNEYQSLLRDHKQNTNALPLQPFIMWWRFHIKATFSNETLNNIQPTYVKFIKKKSENMLNTRNKKTAHNRLIRKVTEHGHDFMTSSTSSNFAIVLHWCRLRNWSRSMRLHILGKVRKCQPFS